MYEISEKYITDEQMIDEKKEKIATKSPGPTGENLLSVTFSMTVYLISVKMSIA